MGHHGTKRGVMVYLPEDLHRWLKARAALEGTTLSAIIEEAARGAYPDAPGGVSRAAETVATYSASRGRRGATTQPPEGR